MPSNTAKQNGLVEASIYKIENKQVLVEISDDGAGIKPEEHLPRIFEKIYTGPIWPAAGKVGGSGQDSPFAKHIITHGQSIHVRSKG